MFKKTYKPSEKGFVSQNWDYPNKNNDYISLKHVEYNSISP